MHPSPLNDAAKRENALTLASALGVSADIAAAMLDAHVLVTASADDYVAITVAKGPRDVAPPNNRPRGTSRDHA